MTTATPVPPSDALPPAVDEVPLQTPGGIVDAAAGALPTLIQDVLALGAQDGQAPPTLWPALKTILPRLPGQVKAESLAVLVTHAGKLDGTTRVDLVRTALEICDEAEPSARKMILQNLALVGTAADDRSAGALQDALGALLEHIAEGMGTSADPDRQRLDFDTFFEVCGRLPRPFRTPLIVELKRVSGLASTREHWRSIVADLPLRIADLQQATPRTLRTDDPTIGK